MVILKKVRQSESLLQFGIIVYELTDYQQNEILQDQQMYTFKAQTTLMN